MPALLAAVPFSLARRPLLDERHRGQHVLAERLLAEERHEARRRELVARAAVQVRDVDRDAARLVRLDELVEDLDGPAAAPDASVRREVSVGCRGADSRGVDAVHVREVEDERVRVRPVRLLRRMVAVVAVQLHAAETLWARVSATSLDRRTCGRTFHLRGVG